MIDKVSRFTLFAGTRIALVLMIAFFVFGVALILYKGFVPMETITAADGSVSRTYDAIHKDVAFEQAVGAAVGGSDRTGRYIIYSLMAAMFALFATILFLLHQIVGSVQKGDPFIAANARRLTLMGTLILVPGAIFIGELVFGRSAETGDMLVGVMLSLFGSTFVILGKVFREGVAMREDLEGTV